MRSHVNELGFITEAVALIHPRQYHLSLFCNKLLKQGLSEKRVVAAIVLSVDFDRSCGLKSLAR